MTEADFMRVLDGGRNLPMGHASDPAIIDL